VHVDVMDGHFVPNISLGPPVVSAVRRATRLPIDVHLMIENADRYLDAFIEAGAGWISLHVEALPHLHRAVTYLRQKGLRAGVALNPSTPIELLDEILPEVDYVLVMSVNPGFGGQRFIPASVPKIRRLADRVRDRGLAVALEVDGGVDETNARSLVEAGAEILVAGTAVFRNHDPELAARRLIEACG
ncbi:MAG TPA: ribulose-phosphate 3-epimerase, partial [Vicinamibacteria bacterium]